MAEKKCYEFDPVTKVFEFEDIVYDTPLEENIFVLPANSTFEVPPDYTIGETIPLWDELNERWLLVEDHRGKTVYNSENIGVIWEKVGELPEGYSLERDTSKDPTPEQLEWTENRDKADTIIETLKVTVDGDEYDADIHSQNAITRNIIARLSEPDDTEIEWFLAGNTTKMITLGTLKQVLKKAVDETTRIKKETQI